mmetsp:Transcript_18008/g.42173  ORF Transcript_18008/g.42173 Transcript_18008/m.42173 type:complete len:203 (+) Transcript_18008:2116-2724(+)
MVHQQVRRPALHPHVVRHATHALADRAHHCSQRDLDADHEQRKRRDRVVCGVPAATTADVRLVEVRGRRVRDAEVVGAAIGLEDHGDAARRPRWRWAIALRRPLSLRVWRRATPVSAVERRTAKAVAANVVGGAEDAKDGDGKGLEKEPLEIARPALGRVVGRLAAHPRDNRGEVELKEGECAQKAGVARRKVHPTRGLVVR